MYLKKKNSPYKLLPFALIILLVTLFILKTPSFKGNLEQEVKIFLNKIYIISLDEGIQSNIENIFISFKKNKRVYPKLKIEIPFKGFNEIKNDRDKALRYGLLEVSKKVKGTIELDGKIYNADFRLKGNLPDHWNNARQWSLKINIKKNDTLLNLSEFSIVQHRTRNYPYSFLVTENLSRMNVDDRLDAGEIALVNILGEELVIDHLCALEVLEEFEDEHKSFRKNISY